MVKPASAPALAAVLVLGGAGGARAAEAREDLPPPVRVTATPLGDGGGVPGTLLQVRWEVDPDRVASWVADRRLLSFELRPERGRRRVCRHPEAPGRVDEERVFRTDVPVAPEAGCEGDTPCGPTTFHEEWIDVRMWCWGRSLGALTVPGRLEVRYGFPRRGRGRWIAKDAAGRALARAAPGPTVALLPRPRTPEHTVEVDVEPDTPDEDAGPAAQGAGDAPPAAPIELSLSPEDARTEDALVFRVRLRADAPTWVYFRDDLLRFRVRGPLGERACAAPRNEVVPIRELYRRLGGRRAVRTYVSAAVYCPEGTFPLAGVYDVSPVIDLPYDGEAFDLDTVVGTFEGPAVPVRVRRDPGGYVDHGRLDPEAFLDPSEEAGTTGPEGPAEQGP